MTTFRVGIIGCGRPWKTQGATGFGMSHQHALGYEASPDTKIVALADINLENAKAFQAVHGGEHIYQDYQEMLEAARAPFRSCGGCLNHASNRINRRSRPDATNIWARYTARNPSSPPTRGGSPRITARTKASNSSLRGSCR